MCEIQNFSDTFRVKKQKLKQVSTDCCFKESACSLKRFKSQSTFLRTLKVIKKLPVYQIFHCLQLENKDVLLF